MAAASETCRKKGEHIHAHGKSNEVSALAKSIFSATKSQKPKKAEFFQQVRELLGRKDGSSQGIFHAKFHDIQNFFTTNDSMNRTISVERFKFDSPSPDDVVLSGKYAASKVAAAKSDHISRIVKSSTSGVSEDKLGSKKTNPRRNEIDKDSPDIMPTNELKKRPQCGDNLLKSPDVFSDRDLKSNATTQQHANAFDSRNLLEQYKPESWMISNEEASCKKLLHLAFVGHVDSGKSTLAGRLLCLTGQISTKEMHKNQREAKQEGKGSFAFAWILDEGTEERKRGLTMAVAVAHFETQNFLVELLDSPGHKDFIPNMISEMSQADAAVLVVDASIGNFKEGFSEQGDGQIKEHAQIIRSFGIEQLIIAVNKMDMVEDPKERYNSIRSKLAPFLRRCGFKESAMKWIPLSAWENQNLAAAASDEKLKSWYSGPCLLEAIDQFQLPKREISKPFRLPISEVVDSPRTDQAVASGKIVSGAVKKGITVLVMPGEILTTVKGIKRDKKALTIARAGDSVNVVLQGVEASKLLVGGILCHPDYPITLATHIEIKVLCLDLAMPIPVGSQVELYVHHFQGAAKIFRIISILNPKTGEVLKKMPRYLRTNYSALIEVVPEQGICLELYSCYKSLGRVILRMQGRTIAVGVVTQILKQ